MGDPRAVSQFVTRLAMKPKQRSQLFFRATHPKHPLSSEKRQEDLCSRPVAFSKTACYTEFASQVLHGSGHHVGECTGGDRTNNTAKMKYYIITICTVAKSRYN